MSEYRNRISISKDGAELFPTPKYISLAGEEHEQDLKNAVLNAKENLNTAIQKPNRPDFSDLGIGREE